MMFKKLSSLIIAVLSLGALTPAMALDPRADLEFMEITPKVKCASAGPCYVQSISVVINNSGNTDAPNSALEVYASDDAVLDTDPNSPTADTLLKRVSLGKVKADNNRKRTLGGGLFKKVKPNTLKYYFLIIDPDDVVDEQDEANTTVFQPMN